MCDAFFFGLFNWSLSVNTLSMQVYTNCQGSVKYWRSVQLIQSLSMFFCQGDLFQCELPDLPDARYSHTQDNLTGTVTFSLAHLLIGLFSQQKWPLIGHQHISSLKWQLVVATPERIASLWTPHQDSGGQHNLWLTDISPIKTAFVGLISQYADVLPPASRVTSELLTPRYCHVSWDRGQVS